MDRPGKFGGGLAVLIKTLEIKCKEIAYNQSKPREGTTEAQAIEIYLTGKTIPIINVYHHDNISINIGLIETLSEASSDIAILLGDFNAERPTWGSPVQDNKGKRHFLPGLMKDQPYDTIIQRIKLHLDPKKKVIPQRCRFLKRIQQEGESISEYLRELKHLAINCNFVDMLGTMMRDLLCTANKAIELDRYPLPSIDEIFLKLSTSTVLSTLDLSQAYLQVMLAEEAKAVVGINTTKRLFSYKRLPYDVAVAPNQFQRIMEGLFSDLPGVACYIDDILVAGKDFEDHEQKNDRKEECPIDFASRTLTEAEKRFSQLEKKALSITFGVEKFRQYLLGRKFVLVTDNRPLIHIFSPHKPIPICASSRIKRWSLKLAAFNYIVEFRKTSDNSNVDAFSRLPLESSVRESLDEEQVLLLRKSNEVPFSFMEVANETPQDKILSIVLRNVREGNWKFTRVPRENPLTPHYKINEELSLEFGCLQWRERVVIPQKLRSLILNDLHEIHMGIIKMKMISRRAFPQTVIKEFPGGTANEEKFKIKILEFNTKMGNPREVFHEAVRRQEQFTTGCEVYFRNYATGPKREEEVPEVTSGNKEETASVHVPSCTPIPGPVAVHLPSCTPKPEAAAVQVPVRSSRPQRARKPLDRLEFSLIPKAMIMEGSGPTGRESVKDDLHTGRSLSIRNPEKAFKIKSSIKKNSRITIRELPEDLDISFGTCQTIIKHDMHLKRSPAEFVPHLLTNEQKEHRKETCKNMVEMFNSDLHWLKIVIMGDETWVYGYEPETKSQSSQWLEHGEQRFKKAKIIKSKLKCLLITFFDVKRLVHYEFVPEGKIINQHYYFDVLRRLREAVRPK
ncbi:K02A2.6-like [Cordylochernes scorpioides]|uniref:K02A2.6-like n=1 Tax=Cordylochernes scorpioides TaxID=51811 RepID=A0ABY6LXG8_9ARAC|nr:K02A2.6-like [Cordylochernes scorpioides]